MRGGLAARQYIDALWKDRPSKKQILQDSGSADTVFIGTGGGDAKAMLGNSHCPSGEPS